MDKVNLTVPIQVNLDTDKVVEKLIEMDYAPVVHGHWVKTSRERIEKCSVCGVDELWCNTKLYLYCPFCGAKMDESEGECNDKS